MTTLALAALAISACGSPPPASGQNQPPEAAFTVSVSEGPAPLTVAFDASTSTDPDGVIAAFVWDFGDGANGSGVTISHAYATPGSYTARLTVTDDRGATHAASVTITVSDAGEADETATLEAAKVAFHVGEAVFGEPAILTRASIDAALEATRLNGGTATLTGTLRETSPQTFAYDATPSDRLRLELLDGRAWDLVFHVAPQGDFSKDGERFQRNPHVLDVEVTGNAAASAPDLRLNSQPGAGSGTQTGRLVGGFDDADGHRWSVDVTVDSYRRSEVGAGFNELETELLVRGALMSTTRGLSIDLNRYFRYQLVNTVENVDHRMDHSWARAAASYRLQGRVFVGFRDAKPVDRDQWVISGSLTENELAIGQFEASEDATGLSVWLNALGERTRLFFFSYL